MRVSRAVFSSRKATTAPMRLAAKKIRTFSYVERPVAINMISPFLIPSSRKALARVLASCFSSRRVKFNSFWLMTVSFQ